MNLFYFEVTKIFVEPRLKEAFDDLALVCYFCPCRRPKSESIFRNVKALKHF